MTDATSSRKPAERLNKYLALQLGISRREADNFIEKGSVTINSTTAHLGARFTADDDIKVNGRQLNKNVSYRYVLFHKPVGYVSSRKPQGENPTIYDILPQNYSNLKPAGRLDKDSSGLLILTNDGDFAYRLTHPKFRKVKQYEIALDNDLAPLHQQMVSDYGVHLEDGTSQLQIERLFETNRKEWRVIMHEGRNRQIRRTFAALGYTVTRLHRTQFGNYSLGDIPAGTYHDVTMQ